MPAERLPQKKLRKLAVEANVDPRTAVNWLAGVPVRPETHARLVRAASKLGIPYTDTASDAVAEASHGAPSAHSAVKPPHC